MVVRVFSTNVIVPVCQRPARYIDWHFRQSVVVDSKHQGLPRVVQRPRRRMLVHGEARRQSLVKYQIGGIDVDRRLL